MLADIPAATTIIKPSPSWWGFYFGTITVWTILINMQNQLLSFKDFKPSYIENLAKNNNMRYSAQASSVDVESSLYNNVMTKTIELYKLEMTIDQLPCEYYTANFTQLALSKDIETLVQNSEDLNGNIGSPHFFTQIFAVTLPYNIESLYVESRTNITLNNILGLSSVIFKSGSRVRLEGDFNYYFRVYIPVGGEIGAFTILAPNIMVRLLEKGSDYDFEFSKNKVYFYRTFPYSTPATIPLTKSQYDALLDFGVESAKIMARAARPTKDLSQTKYQYMWEIYGTGDKKAFLMITAVICSILFLFSLIIMPILWPLLLILSTLFFIRYRKLASKRKLLISRWGGTDYSGNIVKDLKRI